MAASYEARACGVRGAMGGREARLLCPDAVVVEPRMEAYCRGQPGRVRGVRAHDAAGRGHLDRRGVPRRRRAATHRRRPGRDRRRGSAAPVRDEVGLAITVGVARTKFLAKVASASAKPDGLLVVPPDRRDRVPPPAAGRATLGRRTQDRGQAARPRARHRRRGGTPPRGGARGDARPGVRTAPPRPRPPPGPAPGAGWAAAEVDGLAERAAPGPPHPRGGRRPPRRPRRPGDTPHADRRPGGPHRDAAAALRRLHPRHPLAHPGRGDGPHRHDPRSRPATCSTPRSR